MRKMILIVGLISALILAGCRAEPEEVTLEDVTIDIALDTAEPAVGTSDMLITVNTTEGDPITDATVTVFGTMTHAGMVPFESSAVTENEDGVYRVPVEFSMGGDWIFDVTVELASGDSTTVEYEINGVDGEEMDMDSDEEMDMDSDEEMDMDSDEEMDMDSDEEMDMDSDEEMDMDSDEEMDMDMSGVTSGAYLTITNNGDNEVVLLSASADGIGMIELHETMVDDNDVASMVEQEDGILVDSGETVELMPGGLHIMLINPENDLVEGETITITLLFNDETSIEADFVIASIAPEEATSVESGDLVISGFWARPVTIPEMDMEADDNAVQEEVDTMETAEAGQ